MKGSSRGMTLSATVLKAKEPAQHESANVAIPWHHYGQVLPDEDQEADERHPNQPRQEIGQRDQPDRGAQEYSDTYERD